MILNPFRQSVSDHDPVILTRISRDRKCHIISYPACFKGPAGVKIFGIKVSDVRFSSVICFHKSHEKDYESEHYKAVGEIVYETFYFLFADLQDITA